MDNQLGDVRDVLYPESHLDSPLVAAKLVQAIEYAELHHNQKLKDTTIIDVAKIKLARSQKSPYLVAQRQLQETIYQMDKRFDSRNPVPYPECNYDLFRISDPTFSSKLEMLLEYSGRCFGKIEHLISNTLSKLRLKFGVNQKSSSSLTGPSEASNIRLYSVMKSSRWYNSFLFWFTLKTEMRYLIKNSNKQKLIQGRGQLVVETKDHKIVGNRNLVVIMDQGYSHGKVYYLTYELVLMYCDVIEGRLMVETTMSLDKRYGPLYPRAMRLWDLFDSLFVDLGNNTYNIISQIEPLALSYLQLRDESGILAGAFLNHTLTEITDELKQLGYTNEDDISQFLGHIDDIFNINDVNLTAEFFSFFRSFGHPFLEAETAADKVREHMSKPKLVSFEVMMKGHAIFCGIIINGHRDRHGGAWPPVTFPNHCSSHILNAQRNSEALTDQMCITNWKSFCGMRFGCFMPLSLDEDLSMYMKDKALAAIKKEWDSAYPLDSLPYTPPVQTTSRRLVDVFLQDSKFDPYQILMYVINGEYLHDPEFNISYSLKEKETKQAGRLFAKMTHKMRACQVIAESLIANGIGDYFKDNGMAKSEHDLLKTLHKLSISSVPKTRSYKEGCQDDHSGHSPGRRTGNSSSLTDPYLKKIDLTSMNTQSKTLYSSLKFSHKTPTTRVSGRVRKKCTFRDIHQALKPGLKSACCKGNVKDVTRAYEVGQPSDNNLFDDQETQYETVSSFLTTDLQKFCLNWRYETSAIYAQRLDEIYGLPNFFEWLHKRLERSTLYVCDPSCPPKLAKHVDLDTMPNEHIFIKNPMGGIEGYSQKLWTIATIPYLYLSAYEVGVRIASVVQGDNEVGAITKRVKSSLPYSVKKRMSTQMALEFFDRLRWNFSMVGHNLKASETIISSHFFVYSKRIYYDGVCMTQGLKAVARCVFWSETIVDETRSACSNISTSLAKAIENGVDRELMYKMNILKTIQQLIISLGFSINDSLTPDVTDPILKSPNWIIVAALVPSSLGGFNYLNMARLLVRNIGDPVTASLADVKRMIDGKLLPESILMKIMTQESGTSDYIDWVSDPYYTNIPHSQSITKIIKNITARFILQSSPNPMLEGLFHINSDKEDRELARFLLDRKVILPRAASEIVDNSITGARESLAGLLDTTKGLIRTGLKRGGLRPNLLNKISNYDYNQFRQFNRLMQNDKYNSLIETGSCSVELARAFRQHMWINLSKGRVIYGLETPDVIESSSGYFLEGYEDCPHCSNGNQYYSWFFVPNSCELDNVGNSNSSLRVPYVGSTTEERSEIKLGNIRSPSRALKAAIRIATVYTWAYGDTEKEWNEALYLANQRCKITLAELKTVTPISTSTNIAHRLRDKSTQMKYAAASNSRVSRYVTISNDNLNFEFDGVKMDTNFVYQQFMLTGLAILEDKFRYYSTTGCYNTIYHLHVTDSCCVVPMEDYSYIPSWMNPPPYQSIKSNKLIYDPEPIQGKDLIKTYKQYINSLDVDFCTWSLADLDDGLAGSLAHSIIEIIDKSLKDHLGDFQVIASDDDINSFITEFLLVDPKLFMLHLGQTVAIHWAFDIHYRRASGKYEMTELLISMLYRSSRSAFKILANAFTHPKVYKRFWDCGFIEPVYGPMLIQQDYVRCCLDLIITAFEMYTEQWLNGEGVEPDYILCEPDEDILPTRLATVQARHLSYLCDLYCPPGKMPSIRGLDVYQKAQVLSNHLQTMAMEYDSTLSWNLDQIKVITYPSTLTYLRRGCIKQIRIRRPLSLLPYSNPLDGIQQLKSPTILSHTDAEGSNPDFCQAVKNYYPCSISCDKVLPILGTIGNDSKYSCYGVTRWESHKYRRVGINSTSCYKAWSLSKYLSTRMNSTGPRVFLGEGSGAMLATYYACLGPAMTYYNSGVTKDDVLGQRELNIYPAEVELINNLTDVRVGLKNDLKILFNGRPESTWLGNPECYCYILSTVSHESVSLIHCDLESNFEKDTETVIEEQCHILSLGLTLLSKDGILVTKLCPDASGYIVPLLRSYQNFFSTVEIVLPQFSNPESTEFYLVAYQIKRNLIVEPWLMSSKYKNLSPVESTRLINLILDQKYHMWNTLTSSGNKADNSFETDPDMFKLSRVEQELLSFGFKLNGPYVCKYLLHHDPAGGKEALVGSILVLYKELLQMYDSEHETSSMFNPYPVRDGSKTREVVYSIMRKYYGLLILYPEQSQSKAHPYVVKALRSQTMFLDLLSRHLIALMPSHIRNYLSKLRIKRYWTMAIITKEIKLWWKLLGYSYLLR
ncbi:RNA polymerase [Tupaia paramyxovirus]|uniref:RNA-directed RNA polymerase L n=1 Tax=Tupaia paramyxovirus TaxID=92129 RepID=Q9JFN3_TPMV|nr:RNA polymerase [Tupaia paramyxovirus]ASW25840.1 large protein [Vector TPMV_P-EGFP]ASW25847.1 large protein [Vector TPMV_P-EGFP_H-His6]ASW25854.1 large protein [Vector TPMV_P-EGFP_HaEGFR]ASW25861.1 large protein [Vector TPMV_P-EGFP_HaCD20]AAF63393.1 RNA polymerase [Tupaia paramyxovirus]